MARKQRDDVAKMLELARTGDSAAWVKLVRYYREYLKILAQREIGRRLKDLRSKEDSSDVVQEALFRAYQHFGEFRGSTEKELIAWLRAILARCLANVVRRYLGTQKRDVRLEKVLEDELARSSQLVHRQLASSLNSPPHQAERREDAVVVANGLAKLKADYRQVLIHRHVEELTFLEIAKRMQRSVRSVQNIWARALIQLRNALNEE